LIICFAASLVSREKIMSDTSVAASAHNDSHGGGHGHADGEFAHPASITMLFSVFFTLLALTVLTVWQSTLDIGAAEIWVTMGIATVKAGLVILFFMHLLWDKPLNAIVFLSSIIFVSLFLGFTLTDAHGYHSTVELKDTLEASLPAAPAAATPMTSTPTT
jgi:cytochrome c oxidase subunit IV